MSFKHYFFFAISIAVLTFAGCRRGCMNDSGCVENYNPNAKKEGNCTGCTENFAFNYCPDADENSGNCVYARDFYTDNSIDGWVDVWVSDSSFTEDVELLSYEGRLELFPVVIPDCYVSDSTLTVARTAGEYYYEIQTQTGILYTGIVLYRGEDCRLFDVY